jgi:hypothetical protein
VAVNVVQRSLLPAASSLDVAARVPAMERFGVPEPVIDEVSSSVYNKSIPSCSDATGRLIAKGTSVANANRVQNALLLRGEQEQQRLEAGCECDAEAAVQREREHVAAAEAQRKPDAETATPSTFVDSRVELWTKTFSELQSACASASSSAKQSKDELDRLSRGGLSMFRKGRIREAEAKFHAADAERSRLEAELLKAVSRCCHVCMLQNCDYLVYSFHCRLACCCTFVGVSWGHSTVSCSACRCSACFHYQTHHGVAARQTV